MSTLTVKMPDELMQRLTHAASKSSQNRSDLVREAITSYLDRAPSSNKPSALDLVTDLVGAVDGPEDLSTNKHYFDSLGTRSCE